MARLSHIHLRLSSRRAFTLVELLLVIGCIVVLLSILLPAIGIIRGKAKSVQCHANMRQLYQATLTFTMDNKGELPLPTSRSGETTTNAAAMRTGVWAMDKSGVANLNAGALWKYVSPNVETRRRLIWCPADEGEYYQSGATMTRNMSYCFNDEVRIKPITVYRSRMMRDIKNPAQKIYIVEEVGPNDARCVTPWSNNVDRISGRHGKIGSLVYGSPEYLTAGRSNVVFFDGRVEQMISQQFVNNSSWFTLP